MTPQTDTLPPKPEPDEVQTAKGGCLQQACSPFVVRVTRLSVLPPKEPIFSEQCTHISIVDDAAGEYLQIEQQSTHVEAKHQAISVSSEEWPALKQAVETMLADMAKANY